MSKNDENCVKIEAGQILHPENFPVPNELVCIQVPKVFDQVALRDCNPEMTYSFTPPAGATNVMFQFANNFDITGINVLQKIDSMTKPGFKKLRLQVTVKFDAHYSYTIPPNPIPLTATIPDITVTFDFVVNEIYCPDCIAQIGLVHYPHGIYNTGDFSDQDGSYVKAEALFEVFNTFIAPPTGVATAYVFRFDIGAFFVCKCECIVQLLIPAYGYCPVPPEQNTPNTISSMNCQTFSNRRLTPFPTQFFPDQKWNPLDKGYKREGSED